MNGKKKLAVAVVLGLLLTAVVVGLVWHMNHYQMVDFKFYPKDAEVLDLREEEVSVSHFQKLSRQLPECEILWNVPFQGALYSSDTAELTVTTLSDEDVQLLGCFPRLKTLSAVGCTDYAQLMALAAERPEVALYFEVTLNGTAYPQDAQTVMLNAVTDEELALLPCLRELTTIVACGGEHPDSVSRLQKYCHEKGIDFCIAIGDAVLPESTEQVEAEGITDGELTLLQFMPELKQVHMVDPAASAEAVLALRSSRSDLDVTWEKTICGKLITTSDREIDLSENEITSLAEVEQALAYFPDVTQLFLGECGIDNEEIAAYRERVRENYKVVWVVDLSGKMKVRTDIDNFMPSRDGWGYVRDGEVDNIRYCEDLICIDLGHMGIKNVDFLEPLTKLEYLILAHTEVQYIPAISNCKNLRYLELDWSPIKDLTPLLECTKLEDLNIGMAWPDITPVLEMTWLKNLYMIKGSGRDAWKCTQALPDTRVVASGEYTVASGWRNLPNYYAMRDILGMYYMN